LAAKKAVFSHFCTVWYQDCFFSCRVPLFTGQGVFGMHSIAWWPTVIVLAVATYTDLRSRRIPNWLVLPFLVIGIGVSVWMHGWPGLAKSLEGMALGAVLYGVLFAMGGMGMGDVKLVAAIGAWIGPDQLIFSIVLTGLGDCGRFCEGLVFRRERTGFWFEGTRDQSSP
jgi:Flp pilus assembly protein protease CpaA